CRLGRVCAPGARARIPTGTPNLIKAVRNLRLESMVCNSPPAQSQATSDETSLSLFQCYTPPANQNHAQFFQSLAGFGASLRASSLGDFCHRADSEPDAARTDGSGY